jgi:hypothetical protein
MPPAAMQLGPALTAEDLCRLWTDPVANRGRGSLASPAERRHFADAFVEHVQKDPLVHWAFAPGTNRSPAPLWDEVRMHARLSPQARAARAAAAPLASDLIAAMETWTAWLQDTRNGCDNLR